MNKSDDYKRGYSAGYQSGIRRDKPGQYERVYTAVLSSLITAPPTWSLGKGRKVNSSQTYCELAEHFADEAVAIMKGKQ